MLRFLSVIQHKTPHYNHAFIEKAQHLQRWIPLLTFPRGRLVPRQPRAIKRTTRTELRSESIHSGRYIHWNINITPTVLHCYNIRNGRCVHWNINITPTALRGENIHGGRFVHWNTGTTPTALHHERIHCDRRIHRNIGTTPTALRGCNIQMMRCFMLNYA